MNQVVEVMILGFLLAILILKPHNAADYIKTHIGRLIMVGVLVFLTMRNYLYGVIALAMIVLIHEMRMVEGNTTMAASKNENNDDEDDDEDDEDGNEDNEDDDDEDMKEDNLNDSEDLDDDDEM